jgi:hypothetical protein
MVNILRKQSGMTIIWQGGKIILFMLPFLIAAILIHRELPHIAALPVGYLLLLPGLILWAAAAIQLHPSRRGADDLNLGLCCCFSLLVCGRFDFHRQRG